MTTRHNVLASTGPDDQPTCGSCGRPLGRFRELCGSFDDWFAEGTFQGFPTFKGAERMAADGAFVWLQRWSGSGTRVFSLPAEYAPAGVGDRLARYPNGHYRGTGTHRTVLRAGRRRRANRGPALEYVPELPAIIECPACQAHNGVSGPAGTAYGLIAVRRIAG